MFFFFLMIRRPPRSTLDRSSAASDVYKRQALEKDGWTVTRDPFTVDLTGDDTYFDIDLAAEKRLSLIHISEPTRPY